MSFSWGEGQLWTRAFKWCHSCSEKGNLHTWVLCGSLALRTLSTRAKLSALYSQMSDVEAGGATVFPDLGAAIWPKKVSSSFCGSQFGA